MRACMLVCVQKWGVPVCMAALGPAFVQFLHMHALVDKRCELRNMQRILGPSVYVPCKAGLPPLAAAALLHEAGWVILKECQPAVQCVSQ